jgi:hypothetical protein
LVSRQDQGAADDRRKTQQKSMRKPDSPRHHRPIGRAAHARVGAALKRLIQHGRPAGDQRNARQSQHRLQMKGADARTQIAEVEPGRRGNQDH